MDISQTDARALFTKGLIAVYQERIYPTSFLTSHFKKVTEPTKDISIEVERMGEKVATDVVRGTEGNRVQFTRSTEKIFLPPYYRLYFDATELDLYDRVLGSQGNVQVPIFEALLNKVADKVGTMRDMISRAIELQASNVLFSGVIQYNTGLKVDYKRKAASFVDANATSVKFSNNSTDPFAVLEAGCIFLRQVGRSPAGEFKLIIASDALAALIKNTIFTTRQNLFHMALDAVNAPMRNSNEEGATYHGTLTCGAFKVQLWAYPQYYDVLGAVNTNILQGPGVGLPAVTNTPYVPLGQATLIPEKPYFNCAFAAVPQLIGEPGQIPVQGDFVYGEFLDQRRAKHDFDIQSAPLCVPVAVDQMYTLTNLV